MKKLYFFAALLFINASGMQKTEIKRNPESLKTLCLKHFLYSNKKTDNIQLRRILSVEKIGAFEEYENLLVDKINPETITYLQILLFNDLKPAEHYPMLSTLTQLWPTAEPLEALKGTLSLIIEKKLTTTHEVCVALNLIINKPVKHPRFALAEFLIEKGLNNDLTEYFDIFTASIRLWPTVNLGNLSNEMQCFLTKVASARLPQEQSHSLLRFAAQKRISHNQLEYEPIIRALIKNGADISILSSYEQNQLSAPKIT